MGKMLFKILGFFSGAFAGMLASAIVKKLWQVTPGEDEAPEATDTRRSWGEILIAAAVQGAIFAVIRAAVERVTATGAEKLAGEQPGDAVKLEQGEKVAK
jgi:hypothetical protein